MERFSFLWGLFNTIVKGGHALGVINRKKQLWVDVVVSSSCKCLTFFSRDCPVGWGCRIHRLLLCRGVRPPPNWCPGYDTKQSNGEVQAMLGLWGIRNTPSLPLLPGPLWLRVVAPDKGPIYGLDRTIYHASFTLLIFAFKLCIYAKLNCLK